MIGDGSTADVLATTSTALPALRASLGRLRRRWRWRAMLAGVAWSIAAALAVLCGLEALAIVSGAIGSPSGFAGVTALPLRSALALTAAAFGLALTVAAVVAFIVTPDTAALARAAEQELALRERFSTALEVDAGQRSGGAPGPVRAALLGDAERCAAAIDPRRIVKLTLPRGVRWAVPVLAGVAGLLQWLPPDALGLVSSHGFGTAAELVAATRPEALDAATAANLRRIAELLTKDADARSDPYLRSVARTLERLSAEVDRAVPDRRALAQELDRLLLHTQQAYAQGANAGNRQSDRAGALPEAARLLRQARDELNGQRQAAAAAPPEPAAKAEAAATTREQTDRRPRAPARETPGGRLTEPSGQLRQAAAADALKDLDAYDLADVDPRLRAERAFADEQRRQRAAAAAAAGAATDAG